MRAAAAPWLAIVLPLRARHVTLGTDVCDGIKGVIACCEPFRLIRSHELFWPDRDTVGDGFSRCPPEGHWCVSFKRLPVISHYAPEIAHCEQRNPSHLTRRALMF